MPLHHSCDKRRKMNLTESNEVQNCAACDLYTDENFEEALVLLAEFPYEISDTGDDEESSNRSSIDWEEVQPWMFSVVSAPLEYDVSHRNLHLKRWRNEMEESTTLNEHTAKENDNLNANEQEYIAPETPYEILSWKGITNDFGSGLEPRVYARVIAKANKLIVRQDLNSCDVDEHRTEGDTMRVNPYLFGAYGDSVPNEVGTFPSTAHESFPAWTTPVGLPKTNQSSQINQPIPTSFISPNEALGSRIEQWRQKQYSELTK